MSRFFVGQRVRLVAVRESLHPGWLIGAEGRITATKHRLAQKPYDWIVTLDCGAVGAVLSMQIEPILPEGMKPVEWSKCLWQPEHLRESAHG